LSALTGLWHMWRTTRKNLNLILSWNSKTPGETCKLVFFTLTKTSQHSKRARIRAQSYDMILCKHSQIGQVMYGQRHVVPLMLLAKITIEMANGECAFTRPFVQGLQPARCYRCHLYGHLHYRCKAPTPICGQCALPGHSASTCTSTTFKCAACGGKGPHKATDPGCPVYRRELAKVRPSTY
jgi:hypothetical protein